MASFLSLLQDCTYMHVYIICTSFHSFQCTDQIFHRTGIKLGGLLATIVGRVPLCCVALSCARRTCQRGHLTCVESYGFFLTGYTKLCTMVNLDKIKKTLRYSMAQSAHCTCKALAHNLHIFSFFQGACQTTEPNRLEAGWTHATVGWHVTLS